MEKENIQFFILKLILNNVCWICAVLTLFSLCRCRSIPTRLTNNFTICYRTKDTASNSEIKTNGYYTFSGRFEPLEYLSENYKMTYLVHCAFYKDGSFIYNLYNSAKTDNWGIYSISRDTVKCQFVTRPHGRTWWLKGEIWFRLTAQNTLEWLHLKYWDGITETDIKRYGTGNIKFKISDTHFTTCDSLPDQNTSWLKKNKKFWCSEEDYKTWVKRRK